MSEKNVKKVKPRKAKRLIMKSTTLRPAVAFKSPPAFAKKSPPAIATKSPPAFAKKSPPAIATKSPPAFAKKSPPAIAMKSHK